MVTQSVTRFSKESQLYWARQAYLWWDQGRETTPGDEAHCDSRDSTPCISSAMEAQSKESLRIACLMRSIVFC